jgi:hypothetical protein
MKNLLFISLIIIAVTAQIFSQQKLTGSLSEDSKIAFAETQNVPVYFNYPVQNKKSPILAGIFSLLIPGTGEIYTGQYIKAGIFLVIEAAAIGVAVSYDKKGDNKTTEFQGYADDRWSVVRYAEWLNEYEYQGQTKVNINPNTSLKPWERVNWDELNAAEKGSHRLPAHGEQQYYEMIGKYFQYSAGWDDYIGGANNNLVSPNYLSYSGMRGKANDYYNVASKAVIGIYINHFLSALDAAWSAVSFNKNLAVNIRAENIQIADQIEMVPVINFRYSF